MWDQEGKRKSLNRNERKALLETIKTEADPKVQAFCLVLLYFGCRISEALALTPDSVDFNEGAMVVKTLKRRNQPHFRSIPIPKLLLKKLETLVFTIVGKSSRIIRRNLFNLNVGGWFNFGVGLATNKKSFVPHRDTTVPQVPEKNLAAVALGRLAG